jgi:hypothetical protein
MPTPTPTTALPEITAVSISDSRIGQIERDAVLLEDASPLTELRRRAGRALVNGNFHRILCRRPSASLPLPLRRPR